MKHGIKHAGIAVLLVVAAFLCAAPAKADSIGMTLTGVSGGVQGNVYISPYLATVGSATNVAIVCDDFTHEVFVGESWTAEISTFADLRDARFWQGTQAATVVLYDEAAYLIDNYILSGSSQAGDASFAVWGIFSPAATIGANGWTAGAASLLAEAQGKTLDPATYANYEVLTPLRPTSPQEFIVRTPEPSALWMLCAGLMALMLVARRRDSKAFVPAVD